MRLEEFKLSRNVLKFVFGAILFISFFISGTKESYAITCWDMLGGSNVTNFEVVGTRVNAEVRPFNSGVNQRWRLKLIVGDLLGGVLLEEVTFSNGYVGTQTLSHDFGYMITPSSTEARFIYTIDTECTQVPLNPLDAFPRVVTSGGSITNATFNLDKCSIDFSGLVVSGNKNRADHNIIVDSSQQGVSTKTGLSSWSLGNIASPQTLSARVVLRTGYLVNKELYSGTINVTPCQSNIFDPNDPENNNPVSCIINVGGEEVEGVLTAIGCIPVDSTALANWAIMFGMIIGGMVAVFKIIQGSFMVMTSTGNPDALQEGRSIITAAVVGLIVILSAVVLLSFIGFDILGLQRFGFSL